MPNFNYSFNRAKARSLASDSQGSDLQVPPERRISHTRKDSVSGDYFSSLEHHRGSTGELLRSSRSIGNSLSQPCSPTSCKAPNGPNTPTTTNTSVFSQPVIDLNDVTKETSRFHRKLSFSSQGMYSPRSRQASFFDDMTKFDYHPQVDKNHVEYRNDSWSSSLVLALEEEACITKEDEKIFESHNFRRYSDQVALKLAYDRRESRTTDDLDLDEYLEMYIRFARLNLCPSPELNEEILMHAGLRPNGSPGGTLPQASEDMLVKLQSINARIFDEENKKVGQIDDKEILADNCGNKKKTMFSRSMSKLPRSFYGRTR